MGLFDNKETKIQKEKIKQIKTNIKTTEDLLKIRHDMFVDVYKRCKILYNTYIENINKEYEIILQKQNKLKTPIKNISPSIKFHYSFLRFSTEIQNVLDDLASDLKLKLHENWLNDKTQKFLNFLDKSKQILIDKYKDYKKSNQISEMRSKQRELILAKRNYDILQIKTKYLIILQEINNLEMQNKTRDKYEKQIQLLNKEKEILEKDNSSSSSGGFGKYLKRFWHKGASGSGALKPNKYKYKDFNNKK